MTSATNNLTGFEQDELCTDINDVFEDIFLTEERIVDEHFHQGIEAGQYEVSNQEIEAYGYRSGSEIGREIGFYHGIVTTIASQPETASNEKAYTILQELLTALEKYPHENDQSVELLHSLQQIRNKFRRLCALLKVPFKYTKTNDLSF